MNAIPPNEKPALARARGETEPIDVADNLPEKASGVKRVKPVYIHRMTTEQHKAEGNYTITRNANRQDARLSFAAKGLLEYLLSLPPEWVVCLKHLATVSTDRITAVTSAMNELRKYGYATVVQHRS